MIVWAVDPVPICIPLVNVFIGLLQAFHVSAVVVIDAAPFVFINALEISLNLYATNHEKFLVKKLLNFN